MADSTNNTPDFKAPEGAVNLSPSPLMPKPMLPNYSMTHAAQNLKGADVQVRYKSNAGLRTKQGTGIRMFIEEQRTAVYLKTRKGELSQDAAQRMYSDLNRIRDRMITEAAEWLGDFQPDPSPMDSIGPAFRNALRRRFNELSEDLLSPVKVAAVPTGPVTEHTEAPADLKLSDLTPVVQAPDSGPLNEASVLETGLQQPDLPVFEPDVEEEDTDGVHPVRPDEVSPPEGGNDTV